MDESPSIGSEAPPALYCDQLSVPPATAEETNISSGPDCAVCLQTCVQPVRLPCSHIFCFLCAKGAARLGRRCPVCRQEIPASYLDQPLLVEGCPSNPECTTHRWFYEGREGWWQYDPRTTAEIEAAHQRGDKACEVLIAGFLYVIHLTEGIQVRRGDPRRRRRVKRDLIDAPCKGVAGIRDGGEA